MRKVWLLFFLCLCYSVAPASETNCSEDEELVIPIELEYKNPSGKPDKGRRIPSRHETCLINFNSYTIQTSFSASITNYELWDEEGLTCILWVISDEEMVKYLRSIKGCHQLHIVTQESIYIGYLELE